RKEAKAHAEGGVIVGAPLRGRVLIIDDVISAGMSIGEAVQLIKGSGARPAAVLIALDRQERGAGMQSAAQELETIYEIPVFSIARLDTLVAYLTEKGESQPHLQAVAAYRRTYGV
ncbi:MAG: orotate phosphoribosyltransferase, partial [Acidiferrobacterales bacterium]